MLERENQVSNYNGYSVNSVGNNTNTTDRNANHTIGFEKITISDLATQLQSSIKSLAVKAIITVEINDIRVKTDGNNPTLTEGILIYVGDTLILDGNYEIMNLKVISTSATADSILNIEYKD